MTRLFIKMQKATTLLKEKFYNPRSLDYLCNCLFPFKNCTCIYSLMHFLKDSDLYILKRYMLRHFQGYSVPLLADKSYFSFKNMTIFSSLPDYTQEISLLRETDGMVKRNWTRAPRPEVPIPALHVMEVASCLQKPILPFLMSDRAVAGLHVPESRPLPLELGVAMWLSFPDRCDLYPLFP